LKTVNTPGFFNVPAVNGEGVQSKERDPVYIPLMIELLLPLPQ
jgi:hypothetical protein